MKIDIQVDAKGLACPMPIVRAKKALDTLQAGEHMELLATDKGALNDFQAWVKSSKNEWITHEEKDGVHRFVIKKG
ncbi:sulfurtransferase TusA family protein [Cohnella soli]|uniref:Sulfurtransferase TusA family protein n=1 Tax=Cohnella soli TaxID=425005 RepID=A0ABW0HNS0_9BACL